MRQAAPDPPRVNRVHREKRMSARKGITRREATKFLASAAGAPLLSQLPSSSARPHHGSPSQKAVSWVPRFFNAHQNETVTVLAELIIPQTETPGAKAAKVNEFIDLVLSKETPKVQREFLQGLDWIDRKSRQVFRRRFIELKPEEQKTLLERIADEENRAAEDQVGVSFFKNIKARTIFAYYSSEVGIHRELQYKGLDYLTEFPGCSHPEHLNWDPKA